MPALAPEAFDPEDPMLLRIPCSAMGLSAASQESRLPVARGSSASWYGYEKADPRKGSKLKRDSIVNMLLDELRYPAIMTAAGVSILTSSSIRLLRVHKMRLLE